MPQLGLGLGLQRPAGSLLDADVQAFKAESGATDLAGLNSLVKYLKAESLYSNFVIYPMKSAQNAGSGATVYSLGGLTTNDMTLFNSPTWGATGIAFNGTTQYGTVDDCIDATTLNVFVRKKVLEPVGVGANFLASQGSVAGGTGAFNLYSFGSGNGTLGPCRASVMISDNGTNQWIQSDKDTDVWDVDETVVLQHSQSSQPKSWVNKVGEVFTGTFGTPTTVRNDSVSPIGFFGSNIGSGLSTGTGVALAAFNGVTPTTTQRETITDLINAL